MFDKLLAVKVADAVMAQEYISFIEMVSESIPGFDLDNRVRVREVMADPMCEHAFKDAWLLKESAC